MTRFAVGLCLLSLLIYSGCAPKTKSPQDRAQQDTKIQSTNLQAQPPQRLGQLPTNAGLQLPVVSPDGKWIAFLDFQGDPPPELHSLFTGQDLQAMSAHLQPLAPNAKPRTICRSGAAWPTWSADSKKLLFVAYTDSNRCDLLIHNLQAATTRRISIPPNSVSMPALSHSGQRAAVVVFDPQSQSARLHVVNLVTGNIDYTCPTDSQTSQQIWPQWTPDGRIIFVRNRDGQSHLIQWRPGKSPPQKIAKINISSSLSAMYQAFEALGQPLSPDARRFAYYDTAQDRITLISLANGNKSNYPSQPEPAVGSTPSNS